MHNPTGPARRALTALGTAVLAAGVLAGCATSAPAILTTSAPADPTPAATEALLDDRPATGASAGELVDGFPTALVPVPDGAEILLSSAEPQDDGSVAISLNLRSDQDATGLVDAIRGPLLAAGFAELAPSQPDPILAAQASFARSDGAEFVLVGVLDRDEVRTLTLGGKVRP